MCRSACWAAGTRPVSERAGSVGRASALMASGTAASRVLGLLRSIVLIAAIGATNQAADAFAVANKLPNVLYNLLAGGVLNAVLVPQVVAAYRKDKGQDYVDRLLTFGFAVLAGLTVLLTLAAPLLVGLYAGTASPDQVALAVSFAYWCIPQLFFYGAYALLGQVLNARGSFGPFMWAPALNNVVAIAGFALFLALFGSGAGPADAWTGTEVAVFGGLSTVAVACQAFVLLPFLRRAGIRYRPRWGLRGSGLGRAGRAAAWTFAGLLVGQVGTIVVSRTAAAAPAAAEAAHGVAGNASWDTAFPLFMLPHSLVTVSLATALFTRLAGQAHDRDVAGVRATFSVGMRVVGLFTVPAAVMLALLSQPVTEVILPTARAADVAAIAPVVAALMLGLPAFGAWSLCQRVYYAYDDARGLFPMLTAMSLLVAAGTLLVRMAAAPGQWVEGAALATSASYVLGVVLALVGLRRRLGRLDGSAILRTHVQAGFGSAVAGLCGVAVLAALRTTPRGGWSGALLECVLAGSVMGLVYLVLLRAMHVRELTLLATPFVGVARRLRQIAGRPSSMPGAAGSAATGRVEGIGVSEPVAVGTVLAGRYRLDQALPDRVPGSTTWRATDVILDRPVRARVLSDDDPTCLDAARRAALVAESRLVRVLDVGVHAGRGYVVTELIDGISVAELLQRGVLSADQARAVVGEAAEALETARRRGVHHLALDPSVVHICRDGRVVLSGLAIDAALLGADELGAAEASREDTVGLVRVLYAALTGLFGADSFVPARDLVGDVPADLDTLCTVTLTAPDDGPRTPGELVTELAPWGEIQPVADEPRSAGGTVGRTVVSGAATSGAVVSGAVAGGGSGATGAHPEPAPGWSAAAGEAAEPGTPTPSDVRSMREVFAERPTPGLNVPGTPPPAPPVTTSSAPVPAAEPPAWGFGPVSDDPFDFGSPVESVREGRRFDPTAMVLVVVAIGLLVGLIVATMSLFRSPGSRDDATAPAAGASSSSSAPSPGQTEASSSPEPTDEDSAPPGAPPVIASITTIDPSDTDGEHQELVDALTDGDPSTAWFTHTYKSDDFSGIKDGVGIQVNLTRAATVGTVTLTVNGSGGNVQVLSGLGGTVLAQGPFAPQTVLTLDPAAEGVTSVLLWITQLPTADNGTFRAEITSLTLG